MGEDETIGIWERHGSKGCNWKLVTMKGEGLAGVEGLGTLVM